MNLKKFARNRWLDDNVQSLSPAQFNDQLADELEELAEICRKVPEHYLAFNSESDGLESHVWGALNDYFASKHGEYRNVLTLRKKGHIAYEIGEMTWCIFASPETVKEVLKK